MRNTKSKKLNEEKFPRTGITMYVFHFEDGWKIPATTQDEAIRKYEDIQENIYDGVRDEYELREIANKLYGERDGWSFNYFSDDELAILWAICSDTGASYDDEVYDAIDCRPSSDEILEEARRIVRDRKLEESINKKNRRLNENMKNEIEIFMNTWENYNENGAESGITPTGWMSIDDALEYWDKYEEHEPFINDTEGIPDSFGIGENSSRSELEALKDIIDSDADLDIIEAIIDAGGYGFEDAYKIYTDGDYTWLPDVDNYEDLAYAYIDMFGSLEDAVGGNISSYIDEDAMRRDYQYDVREMMYDYARDSVEEEHEGEIEESDLPTELEYSFEDIGLDEEEDGSLSLTEEEIIEAIKDEVEYDHDIRPVDFIYSVDRNSGNIKVTDFEWDENDYYNLDDEIEEYIDENEDSYMDSVIDDDIHLAEMGELDLSNYFDYESFGRDLTYDQFTITDNGAIELF